MIILNNIMLFSIFIFNHYLNNKYINNKYINNENNIIKSNYKNTLKNYEINNNIKFFLNKKTKIYIHLEQLIPYTNIYHIGITFKCMFTNIRYDLRWIDIPLINNITTNSYTLFWDYTDYTIDDIIFYEKSLNYKYILGVYDCRHYVRNLTIWACNNPTPIWKLGNYIK
tara:strand:- start:211 stop:717 length:507 start_codon:yes stop_codon:yes gene_type:complete